MALQNNDGRPRRGRVFKEELHKINDRISAKEVRLVGEGIEQGVYSIREALKIAEEKELDLVEISPNAEPPVCKVTDYGKFLYEQKKKQKELKAKQAVVSVKEIRFGPHTDEHDFVFKLNHARKFIQEGAKVKAYVFFKGRTIVYKEQGQVLLLKFANELEDIAVAESMPQLLGKKMTMILAPKKK